MTKTSNDINNLVASFRNDTLCCFHLNIRSARHKEDDLSILLDEFSFSFDVIMLCETWYTSNSEVYKRQGYNTFFLNRINKRGGGLILLTKNYLDCSIVSEFSFISADIECLTVIAHDYVYSVMYKPPDSSANNFIDHHERLLNYINDNNLKLILGGDFNIDILKTSPAQTALVSIIESSGHAIVTESATRVTPHSSTLIDVFVTNINTNYLSAGVLCSDISDHLPIYVLADCAIK